MLRNCILIGLSHSAYVHNNNEESQIAWKPHQPLLFQILSGQNLQMDNNHCARQPIHIEVETLGVQADCHTQGLRTEVDN